MGGSVSTVTAGEGACPLSTTVGVDVSHLSPPQQNFFRDAWNIFDFVSVVGSITDILVTELGVSAAACGGGASLSRQSLNHSKKFRDTY